MRICEECRTRHAWKREASLEISDCAVCWTRQTQTSEMVKFIKEERTDFTFLRQAIQEQRQKDFQKMASVLAIYWTYGVRAGQVNEKLTADLRQVVVKIGDEIDWESSYLRRLRLKDQIEKAEARNRDSRPELVRV